MASTVGDTNRRFGPARWLLIPVTIALFALVGLAISTERRDQYQARRSALSTQDGAAAADRDTAGAPSRPPVGGFTRRPATPRPNQGTGDGSEATPIGDSAQSGQGGGQQTTSLVVSGPNGQVNLDLQGFRPLATSTGSDGTTQPQVQLRPGPTGPTAIPAPPPGADPNAQPAGPAPSDGQPSVGLRLDADGTLEPVSAGQVTPGDLVLAPAQGGVDVVGADGSKVEVRPADQASDPRTVFGGGGSRPGATTGLQATRIGSDGRVQVLRPDNQGRIDLGGGVSLQVPRPPEASAGPRPVWQAVLSSRWRVVALVALAVVLAAGAGLALWRRHRRRRAEAEPFGPGWVGPDGVPIDRLEEFLALLAADPDPARAVRLAFSAADRGLGRMPARGTTETAFEWQRRVAAAHPDLAQLLASLCARFADTRFGPRRPGPAERDAALAELRELARLSRAPADEPRVLVGAGAGGDRA